MPRGAGSCTPDSLDKGGLLKNEIAALDNVWAEFEPGLETGSSDPAVYLPQAEAKAKAAGIDRVIAEMQKQYDAWRAKNGK